MANYEVVFAGGSGETILGAWFSTIKLEWLQITIGLFLVSTLFQYRFGKEEKSFSTNLQAFFPLGFFVGLFSTVTDAVRPVLNPFYLNYGVEKET